VTAGRLTESGAQLPLFGAAADERKRRLDRTLDALQERFGAGARPSGQAAAGVAGRKRCSWQRRVWMILRKW